MLNKKKVVQMDDESVNHTWVYRYFYWDAEGRQEKTSHIYATLEAIRLGLGRHVPDSGIRVSNEDVAGGIYIPPTESQGNTPPSEQATIAHTAELANDPPSSSVDAR